MVNLGPVCFWKWLVVLCPGYYLSLVKLWNLRRWVEWKISQSRGCWITRSRFLKQVIFPSNALFQPNPVWFSVSHIGHLWVFKPFYFNNLPFFCSLPILFLSIQQLYNFKDYVGGETCCSSSSLFNLCNCPMILSIE